MEIVSLITSLLALLLTLYSFIRFDNRIKKQERIINSYEIKKIEEEEKSELYANLSLSTHWRDKGTLLLIIENEGPSDAYNLNIKDLTPDSHLFDEVEFPMKTLFSDDSEAIELFVYSDMPNKARIMIDWDDDSKLHHSKKTVINIH